MGTGWIAERFVRALHTSTGQRVVAVASRSSERAEAFATRLGLDHWFGDFSALAASAEVDVVYVATEHTAHVSCAETAMHAGTPVLVEKPLAVNAAGAARLARVAAQTGVFCMEAYWTWCLPKFDVVRQLLDHDLLGDVRTVLADVGEDLTGHRRAMSPEQAGGPMLDLGTYAFGLAHWVLGPQRLVGASGQDHPSGVHGQLAALLSDDDGRQSVLHASVVCELPTAAVVAGTRGTLLIEGPFYQPGPFRVRLRTGETLAFDEPAVAHEGLYWQAAEVARCVGDGRLESPRRPLADSIATLASMDGVRRELGIRFPGE